MTVGSRAEVFHGNADKTPGGLSKKDLIMKDGRMKKEGKKAMVKVFKPKKSGFKLQPKSGTVEYEKKIAKMQ